MEGEPWSQVHPAVSVYAAVGCSQRAVASRIQASGSVPEKPVNGSQNLTYGKQENTFFKQC